MLRSVAARVAVRASHQPARHVPRAVFLLLSAAAAILHLRRLRAIPLACVGAWSLIIIPRRAIGPWVGCWQASVSGDVHAAGAQVHCFVSEGLSYFFVRRILH